MPRKSRLQIILVLAAGLAFLAGQAEGPGKRPGLSLLSPTTQAEAGQQPGSAGPAAVKPQGEAVPGAGAPAPPGKKGEEPPGPPALRPQTPPATGREAWEERTPEEIRGELEKSLKESGASPEVIKDMVEGFMEAIKKPEENLERGPEPPKEPEKK